MNITQPAMSALIFLLCLSFTKPGWADDSTGRGQPDGSAPAPTPAELHGELRQLRSVLQRLDPTRSASGQALRDLANATTDPIEAVTEDQLRRWEDRLDGVTDELPSPTPSLLSAMVDVTRWNLVARRLERDQPSLAEDAINQQEAGRWMIQTADLMSVRPPEVPAASTERLAGHRQAVAEALIPVLMQNEIPGGNLRTALLLSTDALPEDQRTRADEIRDRIVALEQREDAQEFAKEQAASLTAKLASVEQLPADLHLTALTRLNQNAEAIYLNLLVEEGLSIESLDQHGWSQLRGELTKSLRRRTEEKVQDQQRQVDEARREYQRWALERIQSAQSYNQLSEVRQQIEKMFDRFQNARPSGPLRLLTRSPEAREYLEQMTNVTIETDGSLLGWQCRQVNQKAWAGHLNSWKYSDQMARLIVIDTFKNDLLVIDERLLDRPVAKFYQRAFEEGWQSVEDHPDVQLTIAKLSATTPKRTLSVAD